MRLSDIPLDCPLDRSTPYGVQNVSCSQMSIARHYGGIKYNGQDYLYLPATDELIRDDVFRWLTKRERNAKQAAKKSTKQEALL